MNMEDISQPSSASANPALAANGAAAALSLAAAALASDSAIPGFAPDDWELKDTRPLFPQSTPEPHLPELHLRPESVVTPATAAAVAPAPAEATMTIGNSAVDKSSGDNSAVSPVQSLLSQLRQTVEAQEQLSTIAVKGDADTPKSAEHTALPQEIEAAASAAAAATSAAAEAAEVTAATAIGAEVAVATMEEEPELSKEQQEEIQRLDLSPGDPCPVCGKGTLVAHQGGKSPFLGCSCYPRCKMRYYTRKAAPVVDLKLLESLCPQCGHHLAVKKGRYGLYIGCSNYPECGYTVKEHEDVGVECPICHKGRLEQCRTRSGRIMYGCNTYPQCSFIVPGRPVNSTCPECSFPVRFHKRLKAGLALVCASPVCASRRRRRQEIIAPA